MSEAQYWRCRNDNCGFYKARKKKHPYNQKHHKWDDKARWLIAHGVVESPAWINLKCPHCDYNIKVGGEPEPQPLDVPMISLIDSFKKLNRASS